MSNNFVFNAGIELIDELLRSSLEMHPNRDAIKALIVTQISELSTAVGSDQALLVRIYASIGLALSCDAEQNNDLFEPEEILAKSIADEDTKLQRVLDEIEQKAKTQALSSPRNGWDVANYFGRTPEGQRLHILQYGADERDAGQIASKCLPKTLVRLAVDFHRELTRVAS